MQQDPIEALAGYRPDSATLTAEWSDADLAALRTLPFETDARPSVRDSTPLRRTRLPRPRPALALSAALVAAAAVAVTAIALSTGGGDTPVGDIGGLSSSNGIPAGQYAEVTYSSAGADGSKDVRTMWVRNDGQQVILQREFTSTDGQPAPQLGCTVDTAPKKGSFDQPTAAFLASLPTDPAALAHYLQVKEPPKLSFLLFDLPNLLNPGGALASPRLRHALVAALDRIPGLTVNYDAVDHAGNPAIRVDTPRPSGAVMYFDPQTYALVQQGNGKGPGTGQAGNVMHYGTDTWSAPKIVAHLPRMTCTQIYIENIGGGASVNKTRTVHVGG